MDILTLETLSERAWPALEQAAIGGWRLHASGGHTGRANTCWTLQAPDRDLDAAFAAVEDWYARRNLPSGFKTTDGATAPEDLADALRARGYVAHSETLVMTGPLDAAGEGGAVITDDPDDAFQAVMFDALYRDLGDAHERLDTLRRIPAPMFFGRIDLDGAPAAIGACAVDSGWAGISVMRTLETARRQGLAGRIIASLMRQAVAVGARRAYLQVEAANAPAVALYRRLGFETAYGYRYWAKG